MKTETFASILQRFEHRFDLRTVFDDFLTLTLCSFSFNPLTGKSFDEDLYLETIKKYKDDNLRFELPKLLAQLTNEMTQRLESDTGYDVLGEYFEQHLQRKGMSQFFTPWPICKFMAQSAFDATLEERKDEPLRILEPACGSGRMLMAMIQVAGRNHQYFAVDVDSTCVKMTALNLFLSGLFRSEVLCGNFLLPEDFRMSYRTSFFHVRRVTEKEQSPLWHMLLNKPKHEEEKIPPPGFSETKYPEGSQLKIF